MKKIVMVVINEIDIGASTPPQHNLNHHLFHKTKVIDDDGEEQWLTAERRIKPMHTTSVQVQSSTSTSSSSTLSSSTFFSPMSSSSTFLSSTSSSSTFSSSAHSSSTFFNFFTVNFFIINFFYRQLLQRQLFQHQHLRHRLFHLLAIICPRADIVIFITIICLLAIFFMNYNREKVKYCLFFRH